MPKNEITGFKTSLFGAGIVALLAAYEYSEANKLLNLNWYGFNSFRIKLLASNKTQVQLDFNLRITNPTNFYFVCNKINLDVFHQNIYLGNVVNNQTRVIHKGITDVPLSLLINTGAALDIMLTYITTKNPNIPLLIKGNVLCFYLFNIPVQMLLNIKDYV
jgi:LEA14-like dessication related protein